LTETAPGGSWDAERYIRHGRFVPELGAELVDLLAPCAGEQILDLGCGDGALTERIAARGAAVTGVDAAPSMAAWARRRGLAAVVGDGRALPFTARFHAVFSNAALHWMRPPGAVLAGVADALKPGGRFVGELGGHGNVAAIMTAMLAVLARRGIDGSARSPWYFPTAEAYAALLERHGFRVHEAALRPRPTTLPGTIEEWLDTFAHAFLNPLDPDDRATAKSEIATLLAPVLRTPEGAWIADYVRLRFVAVRR